MACPFFLPVGRLGSNGWNPAPRLPLGEAYGGSCQAPAGVAEAGGGPFEPPESVQRDLCNCGYARQRCSHFPVDGAADAVRFSVTGYQEGRVTLVYILEKDHAPVEHGPLDPAREAREPLASQARAFVESYLRQRAAGRSKSASA